MRLVRATIVPLECFERRIRSAIEQELIGSGTLIAGYEGSLTRTFSELVDDVPKLFQTRSSQKNIVVAFHGSSACFARFETVEDWSGSIDDVREELLSRRRLHAEIVEGFQSAVFGVTIPQTKLSKPYKIRPSYAFTYFLVEGARDLTQDQLRTIKVLAEPSLIGLDDMLSSKEAISTVRQLDSRTIASVDSLRDADISSTSSIYITWASIAALDMGTKITFGRMFDLITALEMKTQMVWNKCYALSNYSDAIFSRRTKHPRFSEFYWEIVRAFDDTKGVLTSTSSTRSNSLFSEMIETSRLAGEIARLENKIAMCEKFIQYENSRKDTRYRKVIEILLFVTALSQLLPIMFSLPFDYFKEHQSYSAVMLATLFMVGLVVISIRQ